MIKIDPRLEQQKNYNRAMQSYVMMLYEFVLELEPKKMLEIGVQNGQSTKTILMAMDKLEDSRLISIDMKDSRQGILEDDYPDLYQHWKLIVGDSHLPEILQQAKDELDEGEYYDILFIDGDHKNPGVQQDWDDYVPLVKPGGLILMHDITNQNEDVHEVWANVPNDWEKFGLTWGKGRNGVTPGFGIVRKPL